MVSSSEDESDVLVKRVSISSIVVVWKKKDKVEEMGEVNEERRLLEWIRRGYEVCEFCQKKNWAKV